VATSPRSARGLIADTLRLYWRYPLLFLALAASVIVPYQLIVLAATGTGPLSRSDLSLPVSMSLSITDLALAGSLVSAMHVHAVADVREGERPHFSEVAKRGLAALPVVAPAALAYFLGIFAGLLLFLVPGIVLYLRWFVVAQAAAIERRGWNKALTESHDLVAGHYRHVAVFAGLVLVISSALMHLLGLTLGHLTSALTVTAGICVQVIVWSFGALATALLYFDLVARRPVCRGRRIAGYGVRGRRSGGRQWLASRSSQPEANALLGLRVIGLAGVDADAAVDLQGSPRAD
jgi:hypothetical protein